MTLTVNGQAREVAPDRNLLKFLREDLGLKSVKDGCSQGACGTCTVIIGGRALKACVYTAGKCAGKEITTVEGLSEREREVYAYAFGEAGAVQCGFCIPGMVLCARTLIANNKKPTRAEITKALRGNICRCTGYKKIIDAVILAAAIFRGEREISREKHTGIGGGFRRLDAREKVLGTGKYADDLDGRDFEGLIYASALRSKYPRAKVLSIDTGKAAALAGVIRVFTAADIPGENKVGHLKHDWDTLIPVGGITRYMGDSIAIVAAETEEILARAKALIEVEYEVLTPMTCPEDSLAENAPELHGGGNILAREHLIKGDADAVIAASAHSVTRVYKTPFTEHAFLEPECAVAFPYRGGVYIKSSDQGTYDTRAETAILLGLPPEKIVVENMLVGGGFGGKEDVTVQHQAALVALLTQRPVKMKLTRQESLTVHPKRHPMNIELTTACDENGYLTAMKAKIVADTGAYASLGGPVLQRACTHAAGPYNYQTVDIDGAAVYTNNPPAGAFRGFGVTQTCFATERNIDLLAEMCGLDRWEIRYRNAIRPGQTLPNGQIADAATGLAETLDAVKDVFYQSKHAGIACAMKNAGVGVGIPDTGRVKLLISGDKAHIRAGASCIGQGAYTVFAQILSETAQIDPDCIVIHNPSTELAPDSGTTSGSRHTLITGEAVRRAAELLKAELDAGKTLRDLENREFYGEFLAKTDRMGIENVKNPVSHIAYGYATQVCVLAEDGRIEKIVAAHDVGRAINPKSVEGQIEGGVIMSCGYALTEKYPLDNCVPTAKFGTLGLFRADETPDVQSIIIEKPGIAEAYGAIGIGEITSIPTAGAIAGAYTAGTGIFECELPLKNTPYARK